MDAALIAILFVGGGILLASFTGGFASAIVGGGREDNSILSNALVGFIGWLIAGLIWTQWRGAWPEEITGEFVLLLFACTLGVAWLRSRRGRRDEQSGVQ